ncbi:hypothetical protein [Photorhabdus bodei]|nr:hypothetical protein [Photorhabdus bodei]
MTGVRECSQQRGNLKDDGYISISKQLYPMAGDQPGIFTPD